MAHTIPDAAAKVANDKVLIDAYEACENGDQEWFFTRNKNLTGSASKPAKFPEEKKFNIWWRELSPTAKQVLFTYANFWFRSFEKVSKDDYEDIKKAYAKWPSGYLAVYYGTKVWACNLFIGESLYTYGRNILKNGKYFSAHDIWDDIEPFKYVKKDKVVAGNIAAFNFGGGIYHVEIVTSVDLKENTFCSRGAGRGVGDGAVKCGETDRKISNKIIKFLSI